jgi:hypothetical protein
VSKGDLKNQFSRFYAAKALSPETEERLTSLAQTRPGGSTKPGGRLAPTLAWAAAVAVVLIGVGWTAYRAGIREGRLALEHERAIERPVDDANVRLVSERPRYVVAKFQADMCPLAAQIEPAYEKLRDQYACDSVLFLRFDVTDKKIWRQSRQVASMLGIECAFDQECYSGTMMLIDCESGSIVETLHDEQELSSMEHALAKALP